MKKIILGLLLFQASILFSQNTTISSINTYTDNTYNINDIQTIIQLSNDYRGQKQLLSINPTNYTPTYNTVNWDKGAWFRGYYSQWEDNITGFYNCDIPNVGQTGYRSSQPLYRDISKQVRSLIHLHNRFNQTNAAVVSKNIEMIKDGLSYLITKQNSDGGYIWWNCRPGKNFYDNGNYYASSQNITHVYETGHALATMCDGYSFLRKNNLLSSYANASLLYNAIVKAANNILAKDVNTGYTDAITSNFRAFGAWGLAKAYKVTNNCNYLAKARVICQWLIDKQSKNGGPCDGTWQTGDPDGPNGSYSHDSRMVYHLIILRGLVETLDIIPPTMPDFKNSLVNTIKRGVNHIISSRLNPINGTLHEWWVDALCRTTGDISAEYYYYDDQVEPIALLAYYSNYHTDFFSLAERASLKNLLNIMSLHTAERIKPSTNNQGNLRALMQLHSFSYYIDYINAINTGKKIFDEDGQRRYYDANKITNRTLVGDFDNDGKMDDIAAFYDYGFINAQLGYKTSIHVWKSNGSILDYSNANGWWSTTGYNANNVKAMVVGDFDNDNFEDDIAALYDNGTGGTIIHVFTGQKTYFKYSGTSNWCPAIASGYNANNIKGRVVSGDFDNDGFSDDIAAFYDYGASQTKIHVFTGQKTFFNYSGTTLWCPLIGTGYNANNITDRVTSGDFDNDGKKDDIAAFYDYGNNETRIHIFSGQKTFFNYAAAGYWSAIGYDATKVTGRVISGDFDKDGKKDDLAAFYDYGNNETRIHVFSGQKTFFNYSAAGYWANLGYNASSITGRIVSGDFINLNNQNDIAAFYDAGSGDTRIHVWQNNSNSLVYQGPGGWWIDCAGNQYLKSNLEIQADVTEDKAELELTENDLIKIFPNPFSNSTTIAYKIAKTGRVNISIFDIAGKKISELVNNSQQMGEYKVNFDGSDKNGGIYFCRIETENFNKTIKIILTK
ncbi:MAG: T9SS type A sorting domain-containing protein [Bacteroidota bacterium]